MLRYLNLLDKTLWYFLPSSFSYIWRSFSDICQLRQCLLFCSWKVLEGCSTPSLKILGWKAMHQRFHKTGGPFCLAVWHRVTLEFMTNNWNSAWMFVQIKDEWLRSYPSRNHDVFQQFRLCSLHHLLSLPKCHSWSFQGLQANDWMCIWDNAFALSERRIWRFSIRIWRGWTVRWRSWVQTTYPCSWWWRSCLWCSHGCKLPPSSSGCHQVWCSPRWISWSICHQWVGSALQCTPW